MKDGQFEWDIFLSHASEDKAAVVAPLVEELEARGVRVWHDKGELEVGDKLRESIDHGLANSRFGVVILSEHFFSKKWPQDELEGLVSLERDDRKVILPVWHELSAAELCAFSPMLAGRVGVSTNEGLANVADCLNSVIKREPCGTDTPETPMAAPGPKQANPKPANPKTRARAPLTFVSDGAICPYCDTGQVSWYRWGPGPFGSFNAWFVCNRCSAESPGQEVFGD